MQITDNTPLGDLCQLLEARVKELDTQYHDLIGPRGLVHGDYDRNKVIELLNAKGDLHAALSVIYGLLGR